MIFTRICRQLAMISLSGLLCASLAVAQSASNGSNAASGSKASAADKHFVKGALEGGNAEVQLGQLAQQKSNSDDIKQFGQKMVEDHTKLGDQMKQVAQQLGVMPPSGLSPKDQALDNKLQGLSGESFDKAYVQAMVRDHKKDLWEFKHAAATATDPSVKSAASQGEQVISEHLKMIEQIAQAHHISSGAAAKTSTGGASSQQ
jgi:putative membrane protein